MGDILSVIIGVTIVVVILVVISIKKMIYICGPNEILIFAGAKKTSTTNRKTKLGYKLINRGMGLRIPLLEDVYKMDLTNIPIEVNIDNAFSRGGIPLTISTVANVKISGNEPHVHNAIERFLGKSKLEISKIAQETLEGNLRGVLASLTPEEVNEDKAAFTRKLLDEADEDLSKLGILLDNLQIQNISDKVDYLDSIGRKKSAELQRDAKIAEAMNEATSLINDAENIMKTTVREVNTKIAVIKQNATKALNDLRSRKDALISEAIKPVNKEIARTRGEIDVNRASLEKIVLKLEADVIKPAEAKRDRLIEEAKTQSAQLIAEATASAESLREVVKSWKAAGANARNIFLMEKIDPILDTVVNSIQEINIGKVTVIDKNLTSGEGSNPIVKAISSLEQLKAATGIDASAIVSKLKRISDNKS
jgi:flotillin